MPFAWAFIVAVYVIWAMLKTADNLSAVFMATLYTKKG